MVPEPVRHQPTSKRAGNAPNSAPRARSLESHPQVDDRGDLLAPPPSSSNLHPSRCRLAGPTPRPAADVPRLLTRVDRDRAFGGTHRHSMWGSCWPGEAPTRVGLGWVVARGTPEPIRPGQVAEWRRRGNIRTATPSCRGRSPTCLTVLSAEMGEVRGWPSVQRQAWPGIPMSVLAHGDSRLRAARALGCSFKRGRGPHVLNRYEAGRESLRRLLSSVSPFAIRICFCGGRRRFDQGRTAKTWATAPLLKAVVLTGSMVSGVVKSRSPEPRTTGWTTRRYSSIKPVLTSDRASRTPP